MKSSLRKLMIKKRMDIDSQSAAELSSRICQNILEWDKYIEAESVMIYCDFKNEVRTSELINKSLEKGKRVILPKTIMETHELLPYEIRSIEELAPGLYRINEPATDHICEKSSIGIVFVPGTAFDLRGNRIGYGAGYYDGFLKDYNGIKAGICYNLQIVEDTYADEFDIKMDYIVTELGITNTGDD